MEIELCAASIEAIQIAKEFKFDRIELCQNLEMGGITPSPGFILECKSMGAAGVVIGALNEFGTIDEKAVGLMVEKANGMDVTFHRAFDDTYNYEKSIDTLVDLGVKRILSSGLGLNVERGHENLIGMQTYANGRIEIMAGGGINANNIKKLVDEVKPDAIHFSGTRKHLLDEESMFSETILKVERDKVRRLLDLVI